MFVDFQGKELVSSDQKLTNNNNGWTGRSAATSEDSFSKDFFGRRLFSLCRNQYFARFLSVRKILGIFIGISNIKMTTLSLMLHLTDAEDDDSLLDIANVGKELNRLIDGITSGADLPTTKDSA